MGINSHLPGAVEPPAAAIIYMCPTEGCNSHFASGHFRPDNPMLYLEQTRRNQDGIREQVHTREECPSCFDRIGKRVKRVPYVVTQVVALHEVIKLQVKEAQANAKSADQ